MSDLVRGALISIPKHQYESSEALGLSKVQTYWYIIIPQTLQQTDPAVHQSDHTNDQNYKPDPDDRCGGSVEGVTADHRGKPNVQSKCCIWHLSDSIFIIFYRMLANQYACKISGKEDGGDRLWQRHCLSIEHLIKKLWRST